MFSFGENIKDLNPKQRRFAAEYLKDGNATQAAIRAGYAKKAARQQASRLLTKANVSDACEKRLAKVEITVDYVLGGIKRIADDGEEENNRLKAFELFGKHLKLFTEKHEVQHDFANLTDEQIHARFLELTGQKK